MPKKRAKVGSRFDPFAKRETFHRDYGRYSIAKIHSVHEDLGIVVGLLDEGVPGVVPIEFFNKVGDEWVPNGLACPHIYMEDKRQWSIDRFNELKELLTEREKENEQSTESVESVD